MKRVIKFRGKSLNDKQWAFGDYKYDGTYIGNQRVDPCTSTQFTGMQDVKGNDIYEGDIVHLTYKRLHNQDRNAYVLYKDGEWQCQTADKEANSAYLFPGYKAGVYEIEVIGNIFDTPEKLE